MPTKIVAEDTSSRIVTLDDPGILAAATSDPTAFVDQFPGGTFVIDEVQRAPELILPIKSSIDRDRRPGRFLLTGSSDLLRLARTPDSLAGRAVTVPLRPLTEGEIRGRNDDLLGRLRAGADPSQFRTVIARADYAEAIARGGYPEARNLSGRMRNTWFDSYVERLLERDLADISPRVNAARVGSVLRLLAANQSGEVVKARIARDAGIPETSVTTYIDVLETMYLVQSLRPWTPNLTSRESSRRKTMVADTALALRLARLSEHQLVPLTGSAHLGPAMEGFVTAQLSAQRTWSAEEFELFHYRNRDGLEVDIVAEFFDGTVIGVEVKSGSTLKSEHFAGLRVLRERLGERFLGGYVLTTADAGVSFGDRLWGLPVAALWEM